MIKKQSSLVVVSILLLIGLVASSPYSRAEDRGESAAERFKFAVIAVEASVVRVELDALREVMGDGAHRSLLSVPPNKVWQCIRDEHAGELVAGSQLLVANGQAGELNSESGERHKQKARETGEFDSREIQVSLETKAEIISVERIALEINFKFKQTTVEEAAAADSQAEEEHAEESRLEVTSALVLPAGQARIISAKSNGHIATFLIVTADI